MVYLGVFIIEEMKLLKGFLLLTEGSNSGEPLKRC